MKQKYFQTLPEQEYVFKNYFQTGSKEGCNCADCGTYIVNVVQLFGTADKQTYNVGTTCCNKISKDREVFLAPRSVQRKKIFMTEYKKITDSIKNLEKVSELLGGAVGRFIDIDYSSYDDDLSVNVFMMTKEGVLISDRVSYIQRCFSAVKDIFKGWDSSIENMKDALNKDWNLTTKSEIRKIISEDYKKRAGDNWNYDGSAWSEYAEKNLNWNSNRFGNYGFGQKYPEIYNAIEEDKKLHFPRFW